MKKIPITNERFVLVDDLDYAALINYRWHSRKNGHTCYATTRFFINGKIVDIDMHRVIMGVNDTKVLIDHKDGNGLNNQRSNLRACNRSQNAANRHHPRQLGCTSSYYGVCFEKKTQKWRAYIVKDRKHNHIGLFRTEEDAALAYNKKAIEMHGEFAKQNIIQR